MPRDAAGHLVAGRVSAPRTVPASIPRPEYVGRPGPRPFTGSDVYSPAEIERIRMSGRIAAQAVEAVGAAIRPGVTTEELDAIAHDFLIAHDAYPSTLGYRGFPKSCCTSINEVICHGIPDDRPLVDGDIVNLDVTIYLDGVHGDTNATFLVGEVDPESRRLVKVTQECLDRAIAEVRPGRPFNVIGKAIQEHAEANGFGVVRAFVGHGIGTQFHTDLHVPHYYDPTLTKPIEEGMTFTIEPMITMGSWDHEIWDDGWTAVTADRRRTAQYEHTLAVTADGVEVLTAQAEPLPHQP